MTTRFDSRAFLINFPTPNHATVAAYPDVNTATKAAEKLTDGARFVLGSVTEKTLGVMTAPMLSVLYLSLNPEAKGASAKVTGKKDLIQRLLPLIPEAAASTTPETESETMSETTQETATAPKSGKSAKAPKATSGKKATGTVSGKPSKLPKPDPKAAKAAAKGKATKKAAPTGGGRGRASGFEGKKLTVAASSEFIARMRADSRRTQSFKKIKSGMKYEDAIKAGAHKHDIAIMVKQGQLKVS